MPTAKEKAGEKKEQQDREIAVIETGGKQHTVSVGDTIEVERLPEASVGDRVVFDKVLMVDDGRDATLGTPYIDGAKVEGVVEGEGKGKKVNVIHFRAKSRHFKQQGHRQSYMKVTIEALK